MDDEAVHLIIGISFPVKLEKKNTVLPIVICPKDVLKRSGQII